MGVHQVIVGTLRPDGTIEPDERFNLPPGRLLPVADRLRLAKALRRGLVDARPLVSVALADLLEFRARVGRAVNECDVHEILRLEPTVGVLARLSGSHGLSIRRVPGRNRSVLNVTEACKIVQ